MTVQKVKYTITQADVDNQYAAIHVEWRSAFQDTNYVVTWAIEDVDEVIDLSFIQGDIHNLTPNGFDAILYSVLGQAGDDVYIHAMAQHI